MQPVRATLPIGKVIDGLKMIDTNIDDAYSKFVLIEAIRYIQQNYKLREVLRKYEYGEASAK